MTEVQKRKLIEVALPLEVINRESAREKSIRHGHPSTLHLWWARRPLAAARAVLFSQLVDDPSSNPDRFPTEDDQKRERARLHNIIERLVVWENVRDESLLAEARREILNSSGGHPPAILDPFAGGGTIPLEAQRLGLEAHASDLNPVAVLINKALIEVPPKFRNQSPVFPGLADSQIRSWKGTAGLAADVRAYAQWMREEAERRIGGIYPKASLPDGKEAVVIAWIWARTVECPNPACGIEMPLVRSWWLGKKKGKEAYVVPEVVADSTHPSGRRVQFSIGHDMAKAPPTQNGGTVDRNGAICLACNGGVDLKYVRAEGKRKRIGNRLMATVAEGDRKRAYCDATDLHEDAAVLDRPTSLPEGEIPDQALGFRVKAYGMDEWVDLFTNRQLVALTTFSQLVAEAHQTILDDAVSAGIARGNRLEEGGVGAEAYADAVSTYLAFIVSRLTDYQSGITTWASNPQMEILRNVFARQAIPMAWDFAEGNPFADSSGTIGIMTRAVTKVIEMLPATSEAFVVQGDATTRDYSNVAVSTDPPYYDNIGYSDLSDFFYVWLRFSLRDIHPKLLSTMLVPKADELVANPFRHDGKLGAKTFFEDGFRSVFANARSQTTDSYPMTVYYAFKQSDESDEGESSSGWETLLEGMIQSGWSITATWPMRSERAGRMIAVGTNALASSIVLALRPRPEAAHTTDRRGFISTLQAELPQALRDLQQGAISPVDLPQAAIGPGMSIFSRFASVIESDGSQMKVRSALARINEVLDQVLTEQEGDFDPTSRFAIAWYRQHGYGVGTFGDADNLARARNTSVASLDRDEVLTSRAGKVQLLKPADMPIDYNVVADEHTSAWEASHHLMRVLESDGLNAAGQFLSEAESRSDGAVDSDLVKELAFLLFSIAEKNGWTKDALSFNSLATSWSEIVAASRTAPTPETQRAFDFDEDDN